MCMELPPYNRATKRACRRRLLRTLAIALACGWAIPGAAENATYAYVEEDEWWWPMSPQGAGIIVRELEPVGPVFEQVEVHTGPAWPPAWIYRPWWTRRDYPHADELDRAAREMQAAGLSFGAWGLTDWGHAETEPVLDPDRFPWPRTWIQQWQAHGLHFIADAPPAVSFPGHLNDPADRQTWLEAIGPLWALNLGAVRTTGPEEPLPADWAGLKLGLQQGLAAAREGAPFWTPAPSGFTGIAHKEVLIRWIQLATFAPLMCLQTDAAVEPWRYDQETVELARYYLELRKALEPRLHYWGGKALNGGPPLARPLDFDYPDDPYARAADDQFMLGPDLLVAPILQPGGQRNVYLPPGDWVDCWTGETHTGPAYLWIEAELHRIPLYVWADVYPFYADFLPDLPEPELPPIAVHPVGFRDARGLPLQDRYMIRHGQSELFGFRVTNHTAEAQPLRVRLAPPAGILVEPAPFIRFMLEPDETRYLDFEAAITGRLEAGTYPLRLEVIADEGNVPAPSARLIKPPNWRVLGPFPVTHDPLPARDDPAALTRQETFPTVDGQTREWQALDNKRIDRMGRLDLAAWPGMAPGEVIYLHTTLFAEWPQRARLWFGHHDHASVWLNERKIYHHATPRHAERDRDHIEVVLTAGLNPVLIRLEHVRSPPAFYFRIEIH